MSIDNNWNKKFPVKVCTTCSASLAPSLRSSIYNIFTKQKLTTKYPILDWNKKYFQYIEISEEEMETKSGLMENEAAKITQFYNLMTSSIDVIRTFCDRIPGISDLSSKDRDLLFQSACLELFTLRLAYRYQPVCQLTISVFCVDHQFVNCLQNPVTFN